LLLLRFLRSCAWCGCARTLGSQTLGMTYRIPGTQVSLPISRAGFVEELHYAVEWSRGRGAYCYSCFVHGRLWPDPVTYSRPRSLHRGHCAKSAISAGSESGRRMGLVGRP
jgi:hypothetical protein